MSEPEMYPLVDGPTYSEIYDSFAELRTAAEKMIGSLNFPLSWWLDDDSFDLCIFMPRKSRTTVWSTANFDRAEVQEWLDSFVRAEVAKWYGWPLTQDPMKKVAA